MSGGQVSYMPTDGLCYDPSVEHYWDEKALQKEITRVFEVCHGCRMCFKFCDSFPDLFSFIDDRHDGDVRKLTPEETGQVLGECFQCKLCEVQCPYTPRDGHEFQLDFPRLVHRWKAVQARKSGIPFRDRLLGNPDRAASLARKSLGLANRMNRVRLHRWFLEKLAGIHRDKLLPEFAPSTFDRWAGDRGLDRVEEPEAVLFPTCYVQHNEPSLGRDAVEVLERNGVRLGCPAGQRCCGMPAWEHGDLETLRRHARHNLDLLMPHVERGARVLAINPTCSMMMRREYPELLAGEDRERAARLAEAVQDPCEYLWSLRDQERFNTDFRSTPGPVACHAPCHLRAQSVGFRGRDLIRKIPGARPSMTLECCGHDGTWAMKVEGYEPSIRIGQRAFKGMSSAGAEVWSTECPLAALQFAQHAGIRPLHPLSILARAYRPDGFPTPVPEPEAGPESGASAEGAA